MLYKVGFWVFGVILAGLVCLQLWQDHLLLQQVSTMQRQVVLRALQAGKLITIGDQTPAPAPTSSTFTPADDQAEAPTEGP